jgi:flavin reductase (DIM6/NTAB) family NADH-FMN oxidoreductase RutF
MALDPTQFRRVMGTFATGVTVITMPTASGAWGMTANSVTSLSLDPTLVLVCIDKTTRTHEHILASGVWAVNILSAEQEEISRTYAMKDYEVERTMVGTPYHPGVTGAPIIDGSLSYLDCRTYATYEGGDHTILVGGVQDAQIVQPDAAPLLFFKGRYARMAPAAG